MVDNGSSFSTAQTNVVTELIGQLVELRSNNNNNNGVHLILDNFSKRSHFPY